MKAVLVALVSALALSTAGTAPATNRTLSTSVLTATLVLSADSAAIKRAATPASLGRAAAKLRTDARGYTRRVGAEKPSSSAGVRCKRVTLDTFARFVTASSSFTAFVTATKRGDQAAAKQAYERGKRQLDAALGKLSAAAKLASALR